MAKTQPTTPKLDYEPLDIAGKCILVTGGTTGIGRATALLLAARGARVMIYGRHEQELNDALSDIKEVGEAFGITADQARVEDVQRVFEALDANLGGLDILINNAAVAARSVTDQPYDDYSYVVQANLVGYMACAREAIDRMRERGGGHIVNVGSMSADVREEGSDVYVATKAAIQAWSEALRKQVNKDNIRVTLIEPGSVGTNLSSDKPGIDKAQRRQEEKGEMLKAEDIAECIHFCITQPPRCDVVLVQIRPHKQMI
jgi:NADP-dependent 3-hydroxy acid dehydrogenase YdfG